MPLQTVWRDDGDRDKHAERLPKFSYFAFVINTNKAFRTESSKRECEAKFKKWIASVFSDRNVEQNVLKDRNGKPKVLEEIQTLVSKEYGMDKHRLHANVVIRVRHHNLLFVDRDYLYEVWKTHSGFETLCNIDGVKGGYDRSAYLVWYATHKAEKEKET